jgi:hypothetical protein
MTQSREEVQPSRIELVVLACLSQKTPPTDAELGAVVQELALPAASAEAAQRRARELLEELVRRAWVTPDDATPPRGTRRKVPPRALTESGKRALRGVLQLSRVPSWAQVRDKHLPSLALGMTPGSDVPAKACSETALMAEVLGARFGVRGAQTPMAVCDAIIASALGMPEGGKLTLGRIRAHVLARGIDRKATGAPSPGSKDYTARLASWMACSAVAASGSQRKIGRALARRWVCGEAQPLGVCVVADATAAPAVPVVPSVPSPPASPPHHARIATAVAGGDERAGSGTKAGTANTPVTPGGGDPQPQKLLEVVRETIPRIGTEGRFGEKVYVSAIWRTIERDRKAGDLSLDNFKRWLVSANRDGWLVLARADLVGAMDVRQVTESEINDRGATFHFVLDQRNGASVSQQESHAR